MAINRLVLASQASAGAIAATYDVFGTNAGNETLLVYDGTTANLAGDFNRGGDTVALSGLASSFTIQRSGSSALLTSQADQITVRVPVGVTGTRIVFENQLGQLSDVRTLLFDGTNVMLGAQAAGLAATVVTATPPAPPAGFQPIVPGNSSTQSGRLVMSSDGTASAVAGKYDVFGTNAGNETLTVLDGTSVNLAGDFNRGGDIVRLSGRAGDFVMQRSGSSVVISSLVDDITARIPVGIAGMQVVFQDGAGQFNDARTLLFNGTNVLLGTQVVGLAPIGVTPANAAPVITSATTAAVDENAPTSAVVYRVTATDLDVGQSLSYSLTGADAGLFSINTTTGEVRLNASANYEAKQTYSFTVAASDGQLTSLQAVTLSVRDLVDSLDIGEGDDRNVVTIDARGEASNILDVNFQFNERVLDNNDVRIVRFGRNDRLSFDSDINNYSFSSDGFDLIISQSATGVVSRITLDGLLSQSAFVVDAASANTALNAALGTTGISYLLGPGAPPPAANTPPVLASPIPDRTVAEDTAWSYVVPTSTFSDVDGNTLTYAASLASGASLPSWLTFNASTRTFSGTPPLNFNGNLDLRVTASDGTASVSDDFRLTVTPVNDAPAVANAIADQSVAEDAAWSYVVPANTFSDADGNPLTLSATLGDGTALPAWLTFNGATRTFTGAPPPNFNGSIDLKVAASDGVLSGSDTFRLTVTPVNDAPVVANAITDQSSTSGAAWSYQVPANTFSDPDGNTLTYRASLASGAALPSWLMFNASTRTFSGTPTNGIQYGFESPRVGSLPNSSNGTGFWYPAVTGQPTVNGWTYSEAGGILQPSLAKSWFLGATPPVGYAGDQYGILQTKGTISTTFEAPFSGSFTLSWLEGSRPSNSFWGWDGNQNYSVRLNGIHLASFSTISGQNFALRQLNAGFLTGGQSYKIDFIGLKVTDSTAFIDNISITTGQSPGSFIDVVVTASDGSLTTSDVFRVSLSNSNAAPVVANAITDRTVAEDTAWSYVIPANTFSDADGNTLTYTASLASGATLPAWLTFNGSTRTFTGTPPLNFNGNFDLRVTASDGTASVSDDFRLIVTPVNDAPVVANAIADQSVAEDTAWSYVVPANAFSDVDNASLTLSATLGDGTALPSWLSFNAATRTFSGTPPLNFNGNIDLRIAASDGALSVSDTFRLTVTPVNDAPVVANAIADQNSTSGAAWSYQVPAGAFSDVDGSILTYAAALADGSALPSWLTFNAPTRTFSGTPPVNFSGNIDLRVTASDGSVSVNDNFRLAVASAAGSVFMVLRTALVNNVPSDGLEIALLDGRRIALASSNADITYSTLDADTLALRTNQTIAQQYGQVMPSMIQYGSKAFLAYASQPSGYHADEYGFFINSDGTKGTTLSLMDNWPGADWEPSLARFADGTMVMTFISERNGNYDIWAQNLDANGGKVGSLYLASGALPAHQMMYGGDLTAVISGTKFFLQGWRTIPLSGADANGPRSIGMSLVNATTGTVVQTATVASGLAAFPLTSSESLSINAAGNGLIFYQSGGTLIYRIFSASTSAFTLGTAQSATLPVGGLVNVDVASAVLPNGNIAAAVSGTNGARQYVLLLDINPATGTVGNSVTLLDQSIAGVSGLSSTDFFTSETGWRLPIDISILGSEIVVAYRDAAKDGVGITSLSYSAASLNTSPVVANLIPDRTVAEDTAWSYQVPANTFTDADGNTLAYTASLASGAALPSWLSFNASTRTLSGTPPLNFNGNLDLRVTASDGSSSVSDDFRLTVTPFNDAPVVANAIADQAVAEDTAWSYVVPANAFSDVDNASLTLSAMLGNGAALPSWLSFNGATRTFSGTPPLNFNGNIDLRVTASDGSASVSDDFRLTVTPVNDAPVITGTAPLRFSINENVASVGSLSVSDPDGSNLTFSISGGRNAALFSINSSTGAISFSSLPDFENPFTGLSNSYSFTARVSDGLSFSERNVIVDVLNTKEAIDVVIDSNFLGSISTGVPITGWSDWTNAGVTKSEAPGLVSGLVANIPVGGDLFQWFDKLAPGSYQISFLAKNDSSSAAVLVYGAQQKAGISVNTLFSLGLGSKVYLQPNADFVRVNLNFTVNSNVTFDVNELYFSNSYNAPESSIADSINPPGTIIRVAEVTLSRLSNIAPVVANLIPDRTVAEDAAWSYQVPASTFSDADGNTLTYTASLASGASLPSWLTFNASTRTFSGTPPLNFNGNIDLRVTASDGTASVSDEFRLTVTPDTGLTPYFLYNVSNGAFFWVTSALLPTTGTRVLEPAETGLDSRLTLSPDGSVTITDVRGIGLLFNVGYGDDLTYIKTLSNQPNVAEFPNTFNPNSAVAPTLKSNGGGDSASLSVIENISDVTSLIATDYNKGDVLVYSIIGGVDRSFFTIDAATGAIRFITAPDFERPTDSGGNNIYDVEVQVSDGVLFDRMTLSISVLNVSELGG